MIVIIIVILYYINIIYIKQDIFILHFMKMFAILILDLGVKYFLNKEDLWE